MRLLSLIIPAILALGVAAPAKAQAQTPEPNRLITILTAADPQTQLMAMVLTLNAVDAGAEAEILLCGSAGDIADASVLIEGVTATTPDAMGAAIVAPGTTVMSF